MERCNVHWELYAGDFNLQFCVVCDMGISIENNTALGMSFKVMGTIASQLKALSQNTPQSSIIL